MEPDIFQNNVTPTVTNPQLTDAQNDNFSLDQAEEILPDVIDNNSVTLDQPIPKDLKEVYNNSFVSITRPKILGEVSQPQLLENTEAVKGVVKQMLKEEGEEEQVKLASEILANNQVFLQEVQRRYKLYLAPGAIHQDQTNQNVPTIASAIVENEKNQEDLENSFLMIKNIATKALIFS